MTVQPSFFDDARQFYPTPDKLARRMMKGVTYIGKSILDPMAGDGGLLDPFKSNRAHYDRDRTKTFAIELDTGLQSILREKGHTVIDSDLFNYTGQWFFDIILANPPFEIGADSLLKIFEISNGALIKCLLNTETIRNPYTKARKELAQIIKQYGKTEQLGPVFKTARRPTDVDVTLVTLQNTTYQPGFQVEFDAERVSTADFDPGNLSQSELASYDMFESMESQFKAGVAAFEEMLRAMQRAEHYLNPIMSDSGDNPITTALAERGGVVDKYRKFHELATRKAWDGVYSKTPPRS